MSPIRVIGPRDQRPGPDWLMVDTTSRSTTAWTTDLSPFHLGPCPLYGGHTAKIVENGWQFSKVMSDQLGPDGAPDASYWRWARNGWGLTHPVRYPRGKGAKPAYLYWDGERLGYVAGRLRVYWKLYRDAVAKTAGFARLQRLAQSGRPIALWDFDGRDHDSLGMSLADILLDDKKPMGHAFVLKAMLLFGPDVTPNEVLAQDTTPVAAMHPLTPQADLFGDPPAPPARPRP